jgi:hypothetical protein
MFYDWSGSSKRVYCKGDEHHVLVEDVTNDAVAVCEDAGGGIVFAYPSKFSFFLCLKMRVGIG